MEGNFNFQRTTINVGRVSLVSDAVVNVRQSSPHYLPYRPVQFPRGIGSIGVVLWIIGNQTAQEATPISRRNRFRIQVHT